MLSSIFCFQIYVTLLILYASLIIFVISCVFLSISNKFTKESAKIKLLAENSNISIVDLKIKKNDEKYLINLYTDKCKECVFLSISSKSCVLSKLTIYAL